MNGILEKIFENKTDEELSEFLVNLNKYRLNSKTHIKKYNHLRKIHGEIIDSMYTYLESGKYDIDAHTEKFNDEILQEANLTDIELDSRDYDDATILCDLFVYKNHPKIESITEMYLQKKKFKNEEKIKMLNCMNNSYVGLFKIIAVDRENGYVTYEDVFTHKKFKIIDISGSSSTIINKNKIIYMYNRIITYDDISFATGIHCMMTSNNIKLKNFIKNHKYNKCSNFSRCLILYNISKQEKKLQVKYNNQYGYRR